MFQIGNVSCINEPKISFSKFSFFLSTLVRICCKYIKKEIEKSKKEELSEDLYSSSPSPNSVVNCS